MLVCTSKTSSGRSTEPAFSPAGLRMSTVGISQTPLAAVRTRTMPPRGPGTAPLISSRPLSASTAWIVRFWVVWRTPPMRPAIFMPLNTRPGVAHAPMEPGLRWFLCEPCEELTPWKPWRFMTLVSTHLELLAAVLVLVRRTDDDEDVLLRRQRHRADHRCASTSHRVDNFARRAVDDLMVIRLQSDADLLSRHRFV